MTSSTPGYFEQILKSYSKKLPQQFPTALVCKTPLFDHAPKNYKTKVYREPATSAQHPGLDLLATWSERERNTLLLYASCRHVA
jgi:hypothetical protein